MTGTISDERAALWRALRAALQASGSRRFDAVTEWTGYLPFATSSWLCAADGTRLPLREAWTTSDLDALVEAGCLARIASWRHGAEETDVTVRYEAIDDAVEAPSRILGTVTRPTGASGQPFAFDPRTATLSLGHARPDRPYREPTAAQLAALARALRTELGVGLDRVRVGEYHCYDCDRWFAVMREPDLWSFGMCASCSMDRASELADRDR